MELWEHEPKDGANKMTVGELAHRLSYFVEQDDKEGFKKEIDRVFLGGAWGFLFEILSKSPSGYHWRTMAADIRNLVWACLEYKK